MEACLFFHCNLQHLLDFYDQECVGSYLVMQMTIDLQPYLFRNRLLHIGCPFKAEMTVMRLCQSRFYADIFT